MQHFQELHWHFPELSNSTTVGNIPEQFKMKEIHHVIFFLNMHSYYYHHRIYCQHIKELCF